MHGRETRMLLRTPRARHGQERVGATAGRQPRHDPSLDSRRRSRSRSGGGGKVRSACGGRGKAGRVQAGWPGKSIGGALVSSCSQQRTEGLGRRTQAPLRAMTALRCGLSRAGIINTLGLAVIPGAGTVFRGKSEQKRMGAMRRAAPLFRPTSRRYRCRRRSSSMRRHMAWDGDRRSWVERAADPRPGDRSASCGNIQVPPDLVVRRSCFSSS